MFSKKKSPKKIFENEIKILANKSFRQKKEVKARARQGQGKVKARSRLGQG